MNLKFTSQEISTTRRSSRTWPTRRPSRSAPSTSSSSTTACRPAAKSDAYYALIKDLRAAGVPVHGFSAQAHLSLDYGFPDDLERNLKRFADLRLETAITELDVRMTLPASGVPTAAQLAQQADYYQRTLTACLKVRTCKSFTIWGFVDKYSWVPVFFQGQGAATVMWNDFTRKPAYYALRSTLAKRGA